METSIDVNEKNIEPLKKGMEIKLISTEIEAKKLEVVEGNMTRSEEKRNLEVKYISCIEIEFAFNNWYRNRLEEYIPP